MNGVGTNRILPKPVPKYSNLYRFKNCSERKMLKSDIAVLIVSDIHYTVITFPLSFYKTRDLFSVSLFVLRFQSFPHC